MFKQTNFFAVLKNDEEISVNRIHLTRNAQEELSKIFSEAAGEFLDEDLERIPFDGRFHPDEGEILVIDNFDIPRSILEALEEPTSVDELQLDEQNLPTIKSIFTGATIGGLTTVAFQKFNRSQFFRKKGMNLIFSSNTFDKLSKPGISLPSTVDAVVHDGKLFFKSFWNAKQALDLSSYYREATDADIEYFMEHSSIYVEEKESFMSQADTWIRRKIAFLLDDRVLDKYSPRFIQEKGAEYGIKIKINDKNGKEQIELPLTKQEIKALLRFLDEDIYSGPLSETRYLSSSKRRFE